MRGKRPSSAGIVLAGGQSQRMGCAKAALPWGRHTLLAHVVETLAAVVEEVLVVVKDPAACPPLPARVVADLIEGHALGGLYTGLRRMRAQRAFVCACDAPFLQPALIQALLDGGDRVHAAVPRTAEGLQPLHAVYGKTALPVMARQLRRQEWALHALLNRLRLWIMEPEMVRRLDPSGRSFVNLNTPAEYAAALQHHRAQMRQRA